ncbi:MAG: hypothetical protein Hyperionvirus5_123 [Hyperionvirus sp.]|uniref:Uncharacterized protein n=1 Tax=Hyperionvirus sp. TaxID=2487770 RepID=A0A3G5A7U3_9VIRU|nr:MAG: hypothetical protein Hyperionvirus5_123 [Hyperionvirus sp.]
MDCGSVMLPSIVAIKGVAARDVMCPITTDVASDLYVRIPVMTGNGRHQHTIYCDEKADSLLGIDLKLRIEGAIMAFNAFHKEYLRALRTIGEVSDAMASFICTDVKGPRKMENHSVLSPLVLTPEIVRYFVELAFPRDKIVKSHVEFITCFMHLVCGYRKPVTIALQPMLPPPVTMLVQLLRSQPILRTDRFCGIMSRDEADAQLKRQHDADPSTFQWLLRFAEPQTELPSRAGAAVDTNGLNLVLSVYTPVEVCVNSPSQRYIADSEYKYPQKHIHLVTYLPEMMLMHVIAGREDAAKHVIATVSTYRGPLVPVFIGRYGDPHTTLEFLPDDIDSYQKNEQYLPSEDRDNLEWKAPRQRSRAGDEKFLDIPKDINVSVSRAVMIPSFDECRAICAVHGLTIPAEKTAAAPPFEKPAAARPDGLIVTGAAAAPVPTAATHVDKMGWKQAVGAHISSTSNLERITAMFLFAKLHPTHPSIKDMCKVICAGLATADQKGSLIHDITYKPYGATKIEIKAPPKIDTNSVGRYRPRTTGEVAAEIEAKLFDESDLINERNQQWKAANDAWCKQLETMPLAERMIHTMKQMEWNSAISERVREASLESPAETAAKEMIAVFDDFCHIVAAKVMGASFSEKYFKDACCDIWTAMYQSYQVSLTQRERRRLRNNCQIPEKCTRIPPTLELFTELSRESIQRWKQAAAAQAIAEEIKNAEREKFLKAKKDMPIRSLQTFEHDVATNPGLVVFDNTSSDEMRLELELHSRNLAELGSSADPYAKQFGDMNYCYIYSATRECGVVLRRDPKTQKWDWVTSYETSTHAVWLVFARKASEKFPRMNLDPNFNAEKLVRADFVRTPA